MSKRGGTSYLSKLGNAAFLGRNSRHLSTKESKNLVLVKGTFKAALDQLAGASSDDVAVGRAGRFGANSRVDRETIQVNAYG